MDTEEADSFDKKPIETFICFNVLLRNMVELIGKVSKGSKMDQIYIPKNRNAMSVGSYVVVKPLTTEKQEIKPYFYNVTIAPIKVEIIKNIMQIIDKNTDNENIIITGSFLEKGFQFNDIDILVIGGNIKEKILEEYLGIKVHLISITNNALIKGLETDPLYNLMLSRCVSKKRIIYNIKRKINYKLLDLHLLKSKINNFGSLKGKEKYEIIRNLIAIRRFVAKKIVNKQEVDSEINKLFGLEEIRENLINKEDFTKKYKNIYRETERLILEGIKK